MNLSHFVFGFSSWVSGQCSAIFVNSNAPFRRLYVTITPRKSWAPLFSWLKYQGKVSRCIFVAKFYNWHKTKSSHGVNTISPDSWFLSSHHRMLHLGDHFYISGAGVCIVIRAFGTFQSMDTWTYLYFVALQWTPKWAVWCGKLVWVDVNDASWQKDWEKMEEDHQAGW